MLSKTSVLAIRILLQLGAKGGSEPVPPRRLAEELGESPTYLAKVAGHLVRAGIVRARRGAMGGIVLNRDPASITLLSIVEACQGRILGDFCQPAAQLGDTCAYHQAAAELHHVIVGVLSRWSLAELLARPVPTGALAGNLRCQLLATRPTADPAAEDGTAFVPLGQLAGAEEPAGSRKKRGKSEE
jgi:Rrf2 family protein